MMQKHEMRENLTDLHAHAIPVMFTMPFGQEPPFGNTQDQESLWTPWKAIGPVEGFRPKLCVPHTTSLITFILFMRILFRAAMLSPLSQRVRGEIKIYGTSPDVVLVHVYHNMDLEEIDDHCY